MDSEFVEVFSSEEARQEADRHRRDLAETLDDLSERVGIAVGKIERQVTMPARWASEHPLATLGLSVAAGFLLGAGSKSRPKAISALAQELEGAYLQGRRDEIEQRPPRDPEYWNHMKLADGPNLGAFILDLAKPILTQLTGHIADTLQGSTQSRDARF